MSTVRIPARFNGPPASGHGGYSAGVFAALLDADPAAVSLRAPPPLDRELDVVATDGGVEVRDGTAVVATVEAAAPIHESPPALDPATAAGARRDEAEFLSVHPFPTCFGCGPLREPGDGLRLFAGAVDGRDDTYATDWTPDPALADPAGTMPAEQIWAALDCPGGGPAIAAGRPVVLARFCVAVEHPVHAGEPHAIVSRGVEREGRKTWTAMALYAADGTRLARGDALWITVG